MQQFFQGISNFFQKVTNDGIPFWIVFIRDVVAPIFTITGGVFVFFIWKRRMRKEHKMSRQTAAFELLLAKEMECYKEILDTIHEASSYACNSAIEISGIDFSGKRPITIESLADIRNHGRKLHFLDKNTSIFIDNKIAKEVQAMMYKMGVVLIHLVYMSKASNDIEVENLKNKQDEVLLLLTEIDDMADSISGHIKTHLEEISRIK